MDADTRDAITWALGTLTACLFLIGLAVRFVLLPWLRDHLTGPVDEVRRQVTENRHKHTPPTLPDRIDDVATDVHALARVLEGHLESSDRWLEHTVERLTTLEARLGILWARRRDDESGGHG